jgi:mxaJ protein
MVYGDYARPAPQADIVAAVASGAIDLAYVWGPVAGYFARRQSVPLRLTPAPGEDRVSGFPMAFAVAMGVRRRDRELKVEVERVLERRSDEVARILHAYGVPTVASAPAPPEDGD